MKKTLLIVALILVSSLVKAQDLNQRLRNWDSSYPGVEALDKEIFEFMSKWNLEGLSLSITRNDSLVFAKGYGWADREASVSMAPGSIMRVASVSKLITAVGIMRLVDMGKLDIHDRVFGPKGLLPEFTDDIRDTTFYKITVENLLRHEACFNESIFDPMFNTVQVMKHYGLSDIPDIPTLTRCVLSRGLTAHPGTSVKYSNFCYALLSYIIEKVTGEQYEPWMQENVMKPAGCVDMHIGRNYYNQRFPGEVRYYPSDRNEKVPEFNCSGRMVSRCYGGSNITGLQGAGAWVCSAPELARLVACIDGRPQIADIISAESVAEMTQFYDEDTYPLGWIGARPDKGWTRTGTLAGTSALVRMFPDGECWILITNTGTWKGPTFSRYTRELVAKCRDMVYYSLPSQNFF